MATTLTPITLLIAMICSQIPISATAETTAYSRQNYLPPGPYLSQIDNRIDTNSMSEKVAGISVFSSYHFKKADLPFCVEVKGGTEQEHQVVDEATNKWNTLSIERLSQKLFETSCPKERKPTVEILFSDNSGNSHDGQIKFGEVFFLNPPGPEILLLLRQPELKEFSELVTTLGDKQVEARKMNEKQKTEFLKVFESYKTKKTHEMILQIVMHELGHVLGLGHNFNPAENSIMDYSSRTEFSEYDGDALTYVFLRKLPSNRHWDAWIKPKDRQK